MLRTRNTKCYELGYWVDHTNFFSRNEVMSKKEKFSVCRSEHSKSSIQIKKFGRHPRFSLIAMAYNIFLSGLYDRCYKRQKSDIRKKIYIPKNTCLIFKNFISSWMLLNILSICRSGLNYENTFFITIVIIYYDHTYIQCQKILAQFTSLYSESHQPFCINGI